jgi:hypothetical protein
MTFVHEWCALVAHFFAVDLVFTLFLVGIGDAIVGMVESGFTIGKLE